MEEKSKNKETKTTHRVSAVFVIIASIIIFVLGILSYLEIIPVQNDPKAYLTFGLFGLIMMPFGIGQILATDDQSLKRNWKIAFGIGIFILIIIILLEIFL